MDKHLAAELEAVEKSMTDHDDDGRSIVGADWDEDSGLLADLAREADSWANLNPTDPDAERWRRDGEV